LTDRRTILERHGGLEYHDAMTNPDITPIPTTPAPAPARRVVPALLLLIGLALTILGLWVEEPANYFEKAIRVCTQCIGIG
jgi:hypothetical protein